MELIQTINRRLEERYGRLDDLKPYWRIIYSEDEFEKRLGTFNDYSSEGIYLRTVTEIREVPKYRQWIHNKYVLERLTEVPLFQQEEALCQISYEPIWVFEDHKGNALPPRWDAIELIIASIYHSSHEYYPKYIDDSGTPEKQAARIKEIEESLFGNESEITDALAYKEGVSYANIDTLDGKCKKNGSSYAEPVGQIDDSINFPKRDK
jgi:hypothetical protein